MAVIECVPNISEGRRATIVDAIASAVADGPGVTLLDRSSDGTHNRSVLTLAGDAAGLEQAVIRLFAATLPHVDLRSHSGAHPRLGAVDVVPFIPIRDVTMADCVVLAKRVARQVAERFAVPVFLYEEAAASPDRRNLAGIRRGEFEGLAAKMASGFAPDFGPTAPHPTAGATVIGARPPLIAFNVNLATDRVDLAKAIAVAVRESSGGLPRVKAIGLALPDRGLVQVSMNLTNYETTSMLSAFEAVREQASRRNIAIAESEIVGLVPAAALPADPERVLHLAGFRWEQVLEGRLEKSGRSGESGKVEK